MMTALSLVVLAAVVIALAAAAVELRGRIMRQRMEQTRAAEALRRRRQRESRAASRERPPPAYAEPVPPPALTRALADGSCVLYAGAGLATFLGVPGIDDALAMTLRAEQPEADPLLEPSYDLVLERLRTGLSDAEIRLRLVTEIVRNRPGRHAALDSLAQLPFAGVVTSDLSGAVANALAPGDAIRLTPWTHSDFDAVLRAEAPYVVEAYGNARDPSSVLLDAHDLRSALDRNRDYERFLVSLLSTRSLLFVGASPERIEEFMREVGVGRRARQRQHWALLRWTPDMRLVAQALQRRYGVHVIVDPPSIESGSLERFADRLRTGLPRRSGRGSGGDDPERLVKLRLENIGAFESLSVDLSARRAILLGDNGSGKSTILRAIALALMGDSEATPTASRLLRSGASFGTIELETSAAVYRAELRSERDRVVVESTGFTPVRAGLWLVLGFPPLRGAMLRDPRGPERMNGERGAGADDLLPLLSPLPDQRLDNLKQWIVNAHARMNAAMPERSRQEWSMLQAFFEVVDDLTPGTSFGFGGVDPHTWQVRLDSEEDGSLTFEHLSQGMIAVLGWVGVLLQRLYEMYPDATKPQAQPALALVDEIDAHLHPEWQRVILPLLDKHFPALRLVATTHSPLVVTSMRPDDAIIRLERNAAERLGATTIGGDFKGLTPDEVLTSDAFDLETPLDCETDLLRREYVELLARGETPDRHPRAAQLAERLGEPRAARTPQEEEAGRHLRAWLRTQLVDAEPDERERLVGEAQRYLDRLRAGS